MHGVQVFKGIQVKLFKIMQLNLCQVSFVAVKAVVANELRYIGGEFSLRTGRLVTSDFHSEYRAYHIRLYHLVIG